jgi:hypothetical protein
MPRANRGVLRLPLKAARTEGPPRTRTRRPINRAKRTTRRGRSTPPSKGITSTDGSTIEARGTHSVCVGST